MLDIVLLPTKYLTHMTKANRSPNTIRLSVFAICYYLEYMDTKHMGMGNVYQLDYETLFDYFSEYLN